METRTVEQVERWETRSVPDGFAGLHELADREFTGAVRSPSGWLFVLNGRVIGVVEGSLEDFKGAELTAHVAPHPSLALLFGMQEQGGETRAKYYTNDTPLSEVDETLADGGFTGFVELSENVLSGDYYVAYYGGRSMSVAFVGASEQVLTGEEAFERAEEEVGIYEVRDVDVDVVDVPEPSDRSAPSAGATRDGSAVEADDPEDTAVDSEGPTGGQPEPGTDRSTEAEGGVDTSSDPAAGSDPASEDRSGRDDTGPADPSGGPAEARGTSGDEAATATGTDADSDSDGRPGETAAGAGSNAGPNGRTSPADVAGEEEWRESTTIPSLDPNRSGGAEGSDRRSTATTATGHGSSEAETASGRDAGGESADDRSREQPTSSEPAPNEDVEELRSRLHQREQRIEELEERLSNVEAEHGDLRRERDALREEVQRLEANLETAGSGGDEGNRLGPEQAFEGTNLFVRYRSKGDPTLEAGAAGDAEQADVNDNLRLEHHTQFETDGLTVDGGSFEEFLTGTFEYRFAAWVVEHLLYEIRDTGHRRTLRDLYEAIPAVDRVDFHGSVGAGGEDEDTRQETFDVVMRDRMGNPLFVADLNESRDPTTGDMMGSLVEAATGVARAHEELAGAFQVTESFFEPEALETADRATSGGFLSREKRESFVKLSRKRGYHLGLVESRGGEFHLNVPEL